MGEGWEGVGNGVGKGFREGIGLTKFGQAPVRTCTPKYGILLLTGKKRSNFYGVY